MIGTEQAREIASEFVDRAVVERELGETGDQASVFQNLQVSLQGDAAENQNRLGMDQVELSFKVGAAILIFRGKRLVLRRGASDCGRDISVSELEAVTAMRGRSLICKLSAVKRAIQEISGAIACEHAACPVRAMCGRRKSKNEQFRTRISEAGDRFAPVFPIEKRPALRARNAFPVADQARALSAGDDLLIQKLQGDFHVFTVSEIDTAASSRLA